MELLNRKTARHYYSDPLLGNLLGAVFGKYKGLNGVRGNARIIVHSQSEAERLQDYFGDRVKQLITVGTEIEVPLTIIAEELKRGYELTIPDLYEVLYGTQLLTKREQKELKLFNWTNLFAKVEQDFINEFNISDSDLDEFIQMTFNWFQRMETGEAKGYKVLRYAFDKGTNVYFDLYHCLSALWHLFMRKDQMFGEKDISTRKIRLPTFSAHVTKNPHALDKNNTLGRLFWYALYDIYIQRINHNGNDNDITVVPDYLFDRQIYRDFDILDDDISSISHVFAPNLIRGTSPRTLNLREIEEMDEFPKYPSLYIIENPSIISFLVDELIHYLNLNKLSIEQLPISFPVLLCTIGQSRTASKVFIKRCLESNPNCSIYYSGDLDVPGIQMLKGVERHFFLAQFYAWRMDPSIYLKYVEPKSNILSEEDLKYLEASEGGLERKMVDFGAKVYQELFGKELKEDWFQALSEII